MFYQFVECVGRILWEDDMFIVHMSHTHIKEWQTFFWMILWKLELGDASADDLLEEGGWRVYVSRGNSSSRFWGDFAPWYQHHQHRFSFHQHQFMNILVHNTVEGHGVNCWCLWLDTFWWRHLILEGPWPKFQSVSSVYHFSIAIGRYPLTINWRL